MVERVCSVEGCNREAVHEISYLNAKVLEERGLKLKVYHAHPPRKPGVVYLCEEHYKLWKKLTRRESLIEKMVRKGV